MIVLKSLDSLLGSSLLSSHKLYFLRIITNPWEISSKYFSSHLETCQIAPSSYWSWNQYCSSIYEESSRHSRIRHSNANDQTGTIKYKCPFSPSKIIEPISWIRRFIVTNLLGVSIILNESTTSSLIKQITLSF